MTTLIRKASEKSTTVDHVSRAVRYISAGQTDRIQAILEELNRIHTPETPEESQLTERLALAMARLYDAEAAHDERLRWQQANAAELFERLHHERFTDDLHAWRENPVRMTEVFGKTWHSAMFLRDLWHAVRDAISNGLGVTYDQGKDMVTALGGDWRADRVDIHRGRIFSLILSFDSNPPALIERWVKGSRAGRKDSGTLEDDMDRAHWFLVSAPDPGTARDELESLADNQFQVWSAEAERLQTRHIAEHVRCVEVPPALPFGNSDDIRATLRIQRELTRARNEADKLERRLLALRKSHRKSEPRTSRIPARESAAPPVAIGQSPDTSPPEATMRNRLTPAATHPAEDSQRTEAGERIEQRGRNASANETAVTSSDESIDNSFDSAARRARRPDALSVAKKTRARGRRTGPRSSDRAGGCQSQTKLDTSNSTCHSDTPLTADCHGSFERILIGYEGIPANS
ncbi:hypothetical protein GC170_12360 [bacterium]|nr:hypothetical protein [bacterium]